MAWIEISISVARKATALAEFTLEQLGALAITLEDDEDDPVLEPEPGATPLWPSVHVRGLFEAGIDRDLAIKSLQSVNREARPEHIQWREVGDRDWERAWIDRFSPMKFGNRLWIVPGGMQIPFESENIEIRLDPGLAFGTGTHPTTALCLEWLDRQRVGNGTVVDYGCGSGVLGIAAALKGATRVICVDNDPQALEATADNAARNEVSGTIECHTPQSYEMPDADFVMANILAGPLIRLAPVLLGSLRPGGRLALSGILKEQAGEVQAAFQAELAETGMEDQDGWVLLKGRRTAVRAAGSGQES
jgi:ribosomal protein L11 methyltransferase